MIFLLFVCLAEEVEQDALPEAEDKPDALTEVEYRDNPDDLADPYSEESPDELQNYGNAHVVILFKAADISEHDLFILSLYCIFFFVCRAI